MVIICKCVLASITMIFDILIVCNFFSKMHLRCKSAQNAYVQYTILNYL